MSQNGSSLAVSSHCTTPHHLRPAPPPRLQRIRQAQTVVIMAWRIWTYRPYRGLPKRIASDRNAWPWVNACIAELLGTSSTNAQNALPLGTAIWLWQQLSIQLPNLILLFRTSSWKTSCSMPTGWHQYGTFPIVFVVSIFAIACCSWSRGGRM